MAREVIGNAVQPFRDGLSLLTLAGSGRETEPAGSRRYPEQDDPCGPTLRPGETAGMFAPEGSLVGGFPCGAGDPPATVDFERQPERRNTKATEPLDQSLDTPSALHTECPPRPGVTTLNDFMRLVAKTRVPFPDQEMDPACYGGGVSGSGDVNGPASATDNAITRFDGTSGNLIQNSGVVLLDDDHMVGPVAISMPERSAGLPIASGQGQYWVKDDAPSAPRFTDDTGIDRKLMIGSNNLSEITDALAARDNIGAQAQDADLDAIAALSGTGFAVRTGAGTWAQRAMTATSEITILNGDGVGGGPTFTITPAGITNAMLRNSAALSVIGRSANSTGDPADIAAGTDHQILRRSGTALGFGAVNLAQAAAVTGSLAIANGGTNATTAAAATTNLGVGTGDSPQFAGVNVGHASDTTITRVSAGNLAVEGNTIYRAGGTDVAIADGGTGASDAATARTNLDVDKKVVYAQKAPGDVAINSTTFTVPLVTKSITLAAGDVLDFEAQFLVFNNSGLARTLVFRINVGSFNIDITDGATFGNHASNRGIITLRGSACIISTSLGWIALEVRRQGPAASGTDNNLVLAQSRADWATTASNFTGSQTCEIHCIGNNATATQTATVINATISKRQAV